MAARVKAPKPAAADARPTASKRGRDAPAGVGRSRASSPQFLSETAMADPDLTALLNSLVTERVVYFPIRHHSPACALHLDRLLRERRPGVVLVEGPAGFTPLIPLLLHPEAKAPFAIYTGFAETGPDEDPAARALPRPRRAAYFPFSDHSPELVALRVGAELGATLRFIDLDFAGQCRAEMAREIASEAPRVESLLAEGRLARSQFLQALARRTGCRDHNDLWDHLFESRMMDSVGPSLEGPLQFLRDVAAWCEFARRDASVESLRADGTLAREAVMAAAIRRELSRGAQSIVVVTGGFHTVALPALVNAARAPALPKSGPAPPESVACLVRYSFEQLDALNGYAAGMPAPSYYDALWRASQETPAGNPFTNIAARFLVDLGRLSRARKQAVSLSLADELAACEQAQRLALLRGHPGPLREDLLDGVRSCFVKGSLEAEGEVVLDLAKELLSGTRLGEVPAAAGSPPLVQDFRARAERLRLNVSDAVRRRVSLDLYRRAAHRETSRFLHSLALLEVPFATLTAGPDFVRGVGLERLHEHWECQWSPLTESRLVDVGLFGATVEEAAANRLLRAVVELEVSGRARHAGEAVGLLVSACRTGLHRHAAPLVALIAVPVAEDPSLDSLTAALQQLVLLWESREPLEAHRMPEIPVLTRTAFERSCFLLHQLAATPDDAADATLAAILRLRELLAAGLADGDRLDPELLWTPLAELAAQAQGPALLQGGVIGLLQAQGRVAETELLARLDGALAASVSSPGAQVAFLVGLLRTCRELAWRQPALASAVDRLLATWTDDEFSARLPHLRLAFADLTPRETDQVADVVADLLGDRRLGPLHHRGDFTEADMLAAVRLDAAVRQTLRDDGLGGWLEEARA